MIRPDYSEHKSFELSVLEWLISRGYLVYDATYHSHMPENMRRILQSRWSFTALYLRARADRIAIHSEIPLELEYECKTHYNKKFGDLLIEALPLCHHLRKSDLGVQTLYIWRIPHIDTEGGFWCSNLPTIREIHIPNRWSKETRRRFRAVFTAYFPTVPIYETRWQGSASGDPYVIIDKRDLELMPGWKDLIMEAEARSHIICDKGHKA